MPAINTKIALLTTITIATLSFVSLTFADEANELTWQSTLKKQEFSSDAYLGQRYKAKCPPLSPDDTLAKVYGSKIYSSKSPICAAALHSGIIDREGGPILVQLNPGVASYKGSLQNEIQSHDLPETPKSIVFITGTDDTDADNVQRDYANKIDWGTGFGRTELAKFKNIGQTLAFNCNAASATDATKYRLVGTDRYSANSSICLAAAHAGKINFDGGMVRVKMLKPDNDLVGSIRNSIESSDGAAGGVGTFEFTD